MTPQEPAKFLIESYRMSNHLLHHFIQHSKYSKLTGTQMARYLSSIPVLQNSERLSEQIPWNTPYD